MVSIVSVHVQKAQFTPQTFFAGNQQNFAEIFYADFSAKKKLLNFQQTLLNLSVSFAEFLQTFLLLSIIFDESQQNLTEIQQYFC